MTADNAQRSASTQGERLRGALWSGVLPEALGLCFVTVIFGGFIAAYFITEAAWHRQAEAQHLAGAQMLARSVAAVLGGMEAADEGQLSAVFHGLGRQRAIEAAEWIQPDGQARYRYPPMVGAALGAADAGSHAPVVEAPIHAADGRRLGTVRMRVAVDPGGIYPYGLAWTWGVAAAVTLLVFGGLYRRLRGHLRPMAAIERNIGIYRQGVEKDLATLTLSDALGATAQGWNSLIRQLEDLQRQLQRAQSAGPGRDVLQRFEGTIFRRVVDRLPYGVVFVGPNQAATYANTAGAAALGSEVAALIGQPLSTVVNEAGVLEAMGRVLTGACGSATVDVTQGEGEQQVDQRYRVIALAEDGTGGDVLLTVEDISHIREGQRARDNFLYHVTHELRTPLTNIHAYAETLTKPGFDDEQTRKECYNVIISETRRLSSLVENILSISQFEVGSARLDLGEVDLQRLMRQTVQDNLGHADEKRIDLTLALPPKVPKIQGDKQRLSVLLNNLIGNAIKYTSEGGKVHVQLAVTPETIEIAVADNGIGIAEEDQPHVFDKFYRAADDAVQTVTGTGLGLAIAREVARLHGGDIRLASQRGKGSTFTIELPLPSEARAHRAGSVAGGGAEVSKP